MKPKLVLLVICVFIVLIGSVSANSIYLFANEDHIYQTSVECAGNTPVTYYMDSPARGDFDLVVYDTYSGRRYLSAEYGDVQESVTVPQHAGYTHVIFVFSENGDGVFTLSTKDDVVTWHDDTITDLGYYSSTTQASKMVDRSYNEYI
ncbi:MAG TPA: hypothetical protein VN372_15010 [Methanospirillum sp.]|nr:hypothetical protein [Methanospirillum sp.]